MLDPLLKRHFYCSDISRQSGESIMGTGGTARTWLLLEYPGGWEPHAIDQSSLPETVKSRLEQLAKSPLKVKSHLIKQDRRHLDQITLFVVFARELAPVAYRFRLANYLELLELDLPALALGQIPQNAELVNHPLFMVCTHGRRDKCCAKFGYPRFKLLHEHHPESAWQISHVGGDRFAANMVCFPHGVFYGHVSDEDAVAIRENYTEGSLCLKNYRGRSCYSKEGQAAEYFARCESGITALDQLTLVELVKTEGEPIWWASFNEPGANASHQVRFTRRHSDFHSLLTCHATDPKTVAQYSLIEYSKILGYAARTGLFTSLVQNAMMGLLSKGRKTNTVRTELEILFSNAD